MFARGVVYLHAEHLPVPKSLSAKSRVSLTSKLIETKGLQVLHFGHLRKTGGRGSYRLGDRPGGWLTDWAGRIPDMVNESRGEPQMDAESEAYVAPPELRCHWVGK